MQPIPNENRLVTVFGGSGFVGRHVVRALARDGWRIRVACRRPDLAFHLQPLGRVGQIQAVQANVRHPGSVSAAVHGTGAIVNLVGILTPKGRQNFDAVHAFGSRTIARAAAEAGIANFIQMSALGADANSASSYARTKAQAEDAVRALVPTAQIIRPSVMFGPEDDFFNRFAAITRMSPVMPLFGGGQTRFQPVYVGDVAQAIRLLLGSNASTSRIYEFGGPETKTFEELLRYIAAETERKRLFVPTPWAVARVQAFLLELVNMLSLGIWPDWLTVTRDQIALLQSDNVVTQNAIDEGRTLQGLGISPESIETIVPTYLYRFRKAGQFNARNAT